jgi:hypothetical protein
LMRIIIKARPTFRTKTNLIVTVWLVTIGTKFYVASEFFVLISLFRSFHVSIVSKIILS